MGINEEFNFYFYVKVVEYDRNLIFQITQKRFFKNE